MRVLVTGGAGFIGSHRTDAAGLTATVLAFGPELTEEWCSG